MANDTRNNSGPWFFFGIVIAAILVAQALQGRDRQAALDGSEKSDLVAILGQTRRVSEARAFRSATLTAVMGECSLDLRRAVVAEGADARVDIFAMMGSVTLRVPEGWMIDTQAIPVMGGVTDLRVPAVPDATDAVSAGRPTRLVLHGFVMMGGIIIKS
jgi:predicted membrane protein